MGVINRLTHDTRGNRDTRDRGMEIGIEIGAAADTGGPGDFTGAIGQPDRCDAPSRASPHQIRALGVPRFAIG